MPLVRIRILADAESRPGLRALVDAACPAGEWRYPDYCYVEVRDVGPVDPISAPMAATLGGALSRLRAAVRRGARGLPRLLVIPFGVAVTALGYVAGRATTPASG